MLYLSLLVSVFGIALHAFLALAVYRVLRYFLSLIRAKQPAFAQGRFWGKRSLNVLCFLAALALVF